MRKVDTALLLVLKDLLEHGSVTRAAEHLNLSQSAVSHSLGRLRALFGDPLFVRRPHGLEPTQKALELQPQIETLLDLTARCLGIGESFVPADSHQHFSISAPEFVTSIAAPRLLSRISETAPGVSLSFVHLPLPATYEALRRGAINVAIGRFEDAPSDVSVARLFEDRFCVACRKGHPFLQAEFSEAAYRAQTHIWANSPSETIPRDAEFDYSEYRGNVVPTWQAALVVAAQTDAIATCPRGLAESQATLLSLDIVDLPYPDPVSVSLAFRSQVQDRGTLWLIDEILEVLGQAVS